MFVAIHFWLSGPRSSGATAKWLRRNEGLGRVALNPYLNPFCDLTHAAHASLGVAS
jgi:hypothetical protein